MKTFLTTVIILMLSHNIMNAQDTLTRKRVHPSFWFVMYNDTHKSPMKLYEIKDSVMVISKSGKLADYYTGNYEVKVLNISPIKTIKIWNSNNVFVGMLLGGISGTIVGAIIGSKEVDDPDFWIFHGQSAESKAAGDIIGCALIGVGAGALAGLIKIRIPLNGSLANYGLYKKKLGKKSIKYKYFSSK